MIPNNQDVRNNKSFKIFITLFMSPFVGVGIFLILLVFNKIPNMEMVSTERIPIAFFTVLWNGFIFIFISAIFRKKRPPMDYNPELSYEDNPMDDSSVDYRDNADWGEVDNYDSIDKYEKVDDYDRMYGDEQQYIPEDQVRAFTRRSSAERIFATIFLIPFIAVGIFLILIVFNAIPSMGGLVLFARIFVGLFAIAWNSFVWYFLVLLYRKNR
ncbi:MAG: hypothetical protein K9W44_06220 [Candidatus Lokiarchaeota archaeon]|nr:hypothetical protein [Candidatus Harpocratesius repetitus]